MKNRRKYGAFLKNAWLGLCLVVWLPACKTLEHGPQRMHYRVVLLLALEYRDDRLAAVLSGLAGSPVDVKSNHYDNPVMITMVLPDERAVQRLRDQLVAAGIPALSFTVNRTN